MSMKLENRVNLKNIGIVTVLSWFCTVPLMKGFK